MTTLPVQLSQASGVPFYRQVVDQVAAMIRSRRVAPGERLPSVRELSQQLLVSLITVRRAYADLESAGLIIRRQGQGTFVAEDVESATRAHALREAKAELARAITHARQLGLRGKELRGFIDRELEQGEEG